jgi:hypothetical protein
VLKLASGTAYNINLQRSSFILAKSRKSISSITADDRKIYYTGHQTKKKISGRQLRDEKQNGRSLHYAHTHTLTLQVTPNYNSSKIKISTAVKQKNIF